MRLIFLLLLWLAAGAAPQATPASRILVIGDSHTAGAFGDALFADLKASGAHVECLGSSGSRADHWLHGTPTRSGFVARHDDGTREAPPWREPHDTPLLTDLLDQNHPDLLVICLGANFRNATPEELDTEVRSLANLAHCKVAWVGPPPTRADFDHPQQLARFESQLGQAVQPWGTFLPSGQLVAEYAGRDGIHYSGDRGKQLAAKWAHAIARSLIPDHPGSSSR